eukprot:COSAG01_NODE_577_length_15268_cov_31.213462_11_plen_137_part_00
MFSKGPPLVVVVVCESNSPPKIWEVMGTAEKVWGFVALWAPIAAKQPMTRSKTTTSVRSHCCQPPKLLSVASPWWVSNKSHKGSSCRRNAKLICNGHGVCGTYVPRHCSPIVVWTHSNDRVAIHTHVGYEMGRYTS